MPRLRQIPRSEAKGEILANYQRMFGDRDPIAEPGTATGTPGNWWTVWANSPEVLAHAQAGFALLRSDAFKIAPHQRELGQIRAGFNQGSKFVFSQHSKGARRAGISPEKVAAIPHWHASDLFDAQERVLLAYTDELTLADGRVQDGTFEALRQFLSDEAILQFTYSTLTYGLHATMSRALRLEFDDVEERIVEVPAPGGPDGVDIMATISGDAPTR